MKLKLFKPKPIFKLNDVFQMVNKADGAYKEISYVSKIIDNKKNQYSYELTWISSTSNYIDGSKIKYYEEVLTHSTNGFRYIGNFETNLKALGLLYGNK